MITAEVKGVTATIAWLDQMKAELGAERGKLLHGVAVKQANLIKEGTRQGIDINGTPFPPLVLRIGTPLDDSGAMLGAVSAISLGQDAAAVIVSSARENMKGMIHQRGSGIYNDRGSTGPIRPLGGGKGRTYVTGSGKNRKWHVAGGYSLGPMKTNTNIGGKIKRGKAWFASVKGSPVRKWFGFRPGDREKLMDEAQRLLDLFKRRMAEAQKKAVA